MLASALLAMRKTSADCFWCISFSASVFKWRLHDNY